MPPTLVTSMLVLVMICKAVHNLGTLIVNVQPWFVFRRILMHFYVTDQLLSVCLFNGFIFAGPSSLMT